MRTATTNSGRQDGAPRIAEPRDPHVRFSVALLLWIMSGIAVFLGLTADWGFTGVVVSVSLILVVFLWKAAPPSTWFQKGLIALFGWSGGLVGWCVFPAMIGQRWIGHDWWQAEADTVSAFGSGALAVAIAGYLCFPSTRNADSG